MKTELGVPPRERRANRLWTGLGLCSLLLLLGDRLTTGQGLAFGPQPLLGAGLKLLAPLLMLGLALRLTKTLDGYQREVQLRAAGMGFLLMLLLSGVMQVLEPLLHTHLEAWVYFAVGIWTWGITLGVLSYRDGQRGE